jgi:hypothetical protein
VEWGFDTAAMTFKGGAVNDFMEKKWREGGGHPGLRNVEEGGGLAIGELRQRGGC